MTDAAELHCRTCRRHLLRLNGLADTISSQRARQRRDTARNEYRDESRAYLDHLNHDHNIEGGDAA